MTGFRDLYAEPGLSGINRYRFYFDTITSVNRRSNKLQFYSNLLSIIVILGTSWHYLFQPLGNPEVLGYVDPSIVIFGAEIALAYFYLTKPKNMKLPVYAFILAIALIFAVWVVYPYITGERDWRIGLAATIGLTRGFMIITRYLKTNLSKLTEIKLLVVSIAVAFTFAYLSNSLFETFINPFYLFIYLRMIIDIYENHRTVNEYK